MKKKNIPEESVFFLTASIFFLLGIGVSYFESVTIEGYLLFSLALLWFIIGCSCKRRKKDATKKASTEKKTTSAKKENTKKSPAKKTTTKKTKKTNK